MRIRVSSLLIALVAIGPLSTTMSIGAEDEVEGDDSVRVENADGTGAKALVLTSEAATYTGIGIAPVQQIEAPRGRNNVGVQIAVPQSSIFYDSDGEVWVYVVVAANTFARKHVVVDFRDSDQFYLSSGLAAGDSVVTVGVAELHGAEFGV